MLAHYSHFRWLLITVALFTAGFLVVTILIFARPFRLLTSKMSDEPLVRRPDHAQRSKAVHGMISGVS